MKRSRHGRKVGRIINDFSLLTRPYSHNMNSHPNHEAGEFYGSGDTGGPIVGVGASGVGVGVGVGSFVAAEGSTMIA